LPFLSGPVAVAPFWLKRFCRIWPSYVVALGWAAALIWGFPYYRGMERLFDPWLWLEHLTLVTSFDGSFLNGVVWSLVHEMRVSLAFPLLMGLVLLAPARRVAGVALGCSLVGLLGTRLLAKAHLDVDYLMTVHYGGLFLLGFLLARHRAALVAWWVAGPAWRRRGLFTLAAAGYTLAGWATDHLPPGAAWAFLDDWAIALAAGVLLVAALAPGRWQALLRHPACGFLGAISYSLYLVHLQIVRVLVHHLIPAAVPHALTALAVVVASLAVAYAFHRLVERPTLAWGRKLAAWRPSWSAAERPTSGVTGV
jgi:peptidoglycan/LPS O-acetylase OafA/YrhL